MDHTYVKPEILDLGTFVDETGNTGPRNWEEHVWPFDEWH